MRVDRRILVSVVLSVGAHLAVERGLHGLPMPDAAPAPPAVEMLIVEAPPPSAPPPEPAPTPPQPRPLPVERSRPRRAPEVATSIAPRDPPPPEQPAAPPGAPGLPVFGVSMESTSTAGGGPAMPVGSPGAPREGRGGGGGEREAKSKDDGSQPVPAYEVTKMPLPQGRCSGTYTDAAKQAAVEGTVVIDLVVGADGRVRDARVVRGLGYGLDEAAMAAAKACRFSPGERNDTPVAVRVREFKIRFVLSGGD